MPTQKLLADPIEHRGRWAIPHEGKVAVALQGLQKVPPIAVKVVQRRFRLEAVVEKSWPVDRKGKRDQQGGIPPLQPLFVSQGSHPSKTLSIACSDDAHEGVVR